MKEIQSVVYKLSSYLHNHTPDEVHIYIARPKKYMDIIFTDWDLEKTYWKFTMDSSLTYEQMIELADKELAKFMEYWESPLAQALREK